MQMMRWRYMHKVQVFCERHPYIGPVFWLLSLQYFAVQIIVAAAWPIPYSLTKNAISDLGNTACGIYADRYVCSPLHGVMNASFFVVGVTIVIGALLLATDFRKNRFSRLGFWFMGASGIGTSIVGLFPENTIGALHLAGAALPFLLGNVALIFFSIGLRLPRLFRYYTLLSGVIALLAFGLFLLDFYIGLGLGGMERLTAYPQTIWLIAFGWYVSMDHYLQRHGKKISYS